MVIRKVILDRIPSQGDVLTITKSGLYFSAAFMKNHHLENMEAISFFFDDEDPYYLGFELYEKTGVADSLALLSSGRDLNSAGRTTKASELIGKSRILQSIQKDPLKANRTFEIKKDKKSNLFFVMLKPAFEHKISFERRNTLPDDLMGIYRYKDKAGQLLYIGKGFIKTRANSAERRDWGIHEIEYSSLPTEEDSLKWESHYLQSYQNEFGLLPPFNRIAGHNQD